MVEKIPPASVWKILKFNKPEWWAIAIGTLSTLLVGGSVPALSVLFGELYGVIRESPYNICTIILRNRLHLSNVYYYVFIQVLSDSDPEVVTTTTAYYSGFLFGLGIITGISTFFQSYMYNYAGVKMTSRFRKLGFSAILSQVLTLS